jgi:hypothetical protein
MSKIAELRSRGTRAPEVVRWEGGLWTDERDTDGRGAPRDIDVFLRIAVSRAAGVDGEVRKAGVIYKLPGSPEEHEQEGNFASRIDEGAEEWHVRICLHARSPGVIGLLVWYDDGRGRVFFDDNAGEMHVAAWKQGFEVIRHEPSSVRIDDDGIQGTLCATLLDLEYHKDVALVFTTDGWKTQHELGTSPEPRNQWHWVRDGFEGMQEWEIRLEIAGQIDALEYAIVYRHGAAPGAKTTEFWADNGKRNFVIRRQGARRE